MAKQRAKQRSREELEREKGERLPKREVMSILSTEPGLISIPEDPTIGLEDKPSDDDDVVPPPGYDV